MPADVPALAQALAQSLDLPVSEANLAEVARNLALAYGMAEAILNFPLPDTLEAAPVFNPLATHAEPA
jgi:hypothetical protein